MDVLSGTASVLAVISLAVQVGEKIKTLCDILQRIQDAPKELQWIIDDLSVLAKVADSIREEAEAPRPHSRHLDTCLTALSQCSDCVEEFKVLLAKYEPGLISSSRTIQKLSGIKVAWKADSIQRYRERLDHASIGLLLARNEFSMYCRATSIFHESHEQNLIACTQSLVNEQKLCHGALASIENQLKSLLVIQNSTKAAVWDVNEHLSAIRGEVSHATGALPNPILQYALGKKIETALCPHETTVASIPRDGCIPISAGYSSFNGSANVFSGSSRKKTYQKLVGSSSTRSLFGSLYITTIASCEVKMDGEGNLSEVDDLARIRTAHIFHPSRWMQYCGMRSSWAISFSKAMSSCDLGFRIKLHRAVPDDAAIFEYCKQGNIAGVQVLFDQGLASPWDRDSRGFTPLFVAARHAKTDVCKLLIRHEADVNARSWSGVALPAWACLKVLKNEAEASCKDRISTISLFFDDIEIWNDVNCSGLLGLRRLMASPCNHQACLHPDSYLATFGWMFQKLRPDIDIKITSVGRIFSQLVYAAMSYQETSTLEQLISAIDTINSIHITRWFSPAHFIASRASSPEYQQSAKYLINQGLGLHVIADASFHRHSEYGAIQDQTPTMIAMRYSLSFFHYRELLRACNVNVPGFISQELRQSPLREFGWDQTTLQILFDFEFEPKEMSEVSCEDNDHNSHIFQGDVLRFGREEWWEVLLLHIRRAITGSLAGESRSLREDIAANSTLCYICQIQRKRDGQVLFTEEDSNFVFPTDWFQ